MGISVANAKVLQHRALRLAAQVNEEGSDERARHASLHRRPAAAAAGPKPFQPDDFEAAQIRTAIDLPAARPGADAPRPEFLADLQSRLAAQMEEPADADAAPKLAARPPAAR